MRKLRLAMAQINATVGALQGNTSKILKLIENARDLGVDVIAFPELAITGYPPEDLLFKADFLQANHQQMQQVIAASRGITVIVGFADASETNKVFNAAAVGYDGKLVGIYHKIYLPNYGVFDEKRYFHYGNLCPIFEINGVGIGINICEDIWYTDGPTEIQCAAGAEIIVNINSSPYHVGKHHFREEMLAARAIRNKAYISYTNMVGGQDELVFDGGSVLLNQAGQVIANGHQFEEDLVISDLEFKGTFEAKANVKLSYSLREVGSPQQIFVSNYMQKTYPQNAKPKQPRLYDGPGEVYQALVCGLHDYVSKNNFARVLVGISGGIDSALTTAIAVDALGKANVLGIAMPSRYSSEHSILDAESLANNLGIDLWSVPIEKVFASYLEMLERPFSDTETGIAEENLQARIRGNILMAVSNKYGWLVLATGNKSEMATGYTTLYGDLAGGYAVIKDVPKTLVYQLSQYRNSLKQVVAIPQNILDKEPSAELRPNQLDVNSLPRYEDLDPILEAYIEEDKSYENLIESGFDPDIVKRVIALVDNSEYKRRQSPPGVKITTRAFGRDRRLPIVNQYRQY